MIRIDTNEKSTFKIYFKKNRFLLFKKYGHDVPEGTEIFDNMIFSATIVPFRWKTTRASGSIMFIDADDGFEYRMTQKSLFGLLTALLSGAVSMERGGFTGLFTFRSTGTIISLDVFGGHR